MSKSSSSSSDWDSMPEEPYDKATNNNDTVQVQTIRPALKDEEQTSPKMANSNKVDQNNGTAIKLSKVSNGGGNNETQMDAKSKLPPFDFRSEVQTEPKFEVDKSKLEKSRKVRRPGKELPMRRSAYRPSTMNSGTKDTSDESSSSETWTPRKKGQDNLAFVTEEKADNNEYNDNNEMSKKKPRPEESVAIFVFEQPSNGYMTSSEYGSNSLCSDRVLKLVSSPLKRLCAEFLGILRLPLHLIFIILGQIILNVVEGFLRPFSEHLLKPILISLHNLLLIPFCVSLNQIVGLAVFAIRPCAKICCCGTSKTSDDEKQDVKTV